MDYGLTQEQTADLQFQFEHTQVAALLFGAVSRFAGHLDGAGVDAECFGESFRLRGVFERGEQSFRWRRGEEHG